MKTNYNLLMMPVSFSEVIVPQVFFTTWQKALCFKNIYWLHCQIAKSISYLPMTISCIPMTRSNYPICGEDMAIPDKFVYNRVSVTRGIAFSRSDLME
jgi:hypothetical protein